MPHRVKDSLFDIKPLHQAIDDIYDRRSPRPPRPAQPRTPQPAVRSKSSSNSSSRSMRKTGSASRRTMSRPASRNHLLPRDPQRLTYAARFRTRPPAPADVRTSQALRRRTRLGTLPPKAHALRRLKLTTRFTAIAEKRGFIAWLCESPGRRPARSRHPPQARPQALPRPASSTSSSSSPATAHASPGCGSAANPASPLAARTHEYHSRPARRLAAPEAPNPLCLARRGGSRHLIHRSRRRPRPRRVRHRARHQGVSTATSTPTAKPSSSSLTASARWPTANGMPPSCSTA